MKIEYLESFFAFIENDYSIKEAAKTMHLTPVIVKGHINNLQHSLRRKLVYSRNKNLFPTEDGLSLYKKTRSLTSGLLNELSHFKENDGKVKLTCTTPFLSCWLDTFLMDFLTSHHLLEISAVDRPVDIIKESCDIFIGARTQPIWQNSITEIPLCQFHIMMCASESYLEKYGTPQSIEDLKNHNLLGFTDDERFHTFQTPNATINQIPHYKNYISFTSGFNILQSISSGIGMSTISIESAMAQNQTIKPIMTDVFKPQLVDVYIFVQDELINEPKVQRAISIIKKSTNRFLEVFDEKYERLTGARIYR